MTDPIMARLDAIRDAADKAKPGPWTPVWEEGDDWWVIYGAPHYDGGHYRLCPEVAIVEGDSTWSDDAAFIAAARTNVEQMERALRVVLGLHKPVEVEPSDTVCGECSTLLPIGRFLRTVEWPCPTVTSIEEALS